MLERVRPAAPWKVSRPKFISTAETPPRLASLTPPVRAVPPNHSRECSEEFFYAYVFRLGLYRPRRRLPHDPRPRLLRNLFRNRSEAHPLAGAHDAPRPRHVHRGH